MSHLIFFLDPTDFLIHHRGMKVPCAVVSMVARFICESIQSGGLAGSPADLGAAAGRFVESQVPALIAFHVVDEPQVPDLLRLSERVGKGFAVVLLEEKEGS